MQIKLWALRAACGLAAASVAVSAHSAPASPDCAVQGMSAADKQLVQLGKTSDQIKADEKVAVAGFDKRLANCAKTHGWTMIEKSRIEQLQLWTFMAEGQRAAVSKFGIWPDNVRDAVNELPQHILGERSWALKKPDLLTVIEAGLARRGSDLVLLRASKPASEAVSSLASSYAHARQERIKLGLELSQPTPAPVVPKAVAVAAKPVVPQPAAPIIKPVPTPPVTIAAKPAPAATPKTPAAQKPVELVEIDYSPLLKGMLYPAKPWNCALSAMSAADKQGWEADYRNHARIEAARDVAVQSCALKHKWNKAQIDDVADYTLKWIIVEELGDFLREKDSIIDSGAEAIRKLADADLASAVGYRETPALKAVIQHNIATYSPILLDKPFSEKEIESIMRLNKLWAQIELFHRRYGVKHPL